MEIVQDPPDANSAIVDNTSRHLPAPAFLRCNFSTATAWVAVQTPWLDRPEFDEIVQHETKGKKSKSYVNKQRIFSLESSEA